MSFQPTNAAIRATDASLTGDPVVLLQPLQLFSGEFLYYALVFFVLALVAALVGFRGVAGISMGIARIFVLLFLVIAIVTLLL